MLHHLLVLSLFFAIPFAQLRTDTNTLFIALQEADAIEKFDISGVESTPSPWKTGISVTCVQQSPFDGYLYGASRDAAEIFWLDPVTGVELGRFPIPAPPAIPARTFSEDLTFGGPRNNLYICYQTQPPDFGDPPDPGDSCGCTDFGGVIEFDLNTYTIVNQYRMVGQLCSSIRFDLTGQKLYVVSHHGAWVVLDPDLNLLQVLQFTVFGREAGQISIGPDGDLYEVDQDYYTVQKFDANNGTYITQLYNPNDFNASGFAVNGPYYSGNAWGPDDLLYSVQDIDGGPIKKFGTDLVYVANFSSDPILHETSDCCHPRYLAWAQVPFIASPITTPVPTFLPTPSPCPVCPKPTSCPKVKCPTATPAKCPAPAPCPQCVQCPGNPVPNQTPVPPPPPQGGKKGGAGKKAKKGKSAGKTKKGAKKAGKKGKGK